MSRKEKNKLPITLPDYYRAFQVIHGILLNEDSTPHKACLFFANAGAEILNRQFKLPAVPIAGAAFYCLHDESDSILSFADLTQDYVSSNNQAFHAWVQCGEWIIDFMGPLFPEALKDTGLTVSIPRKMFQKNASSMADSLEGLSKSGGYLLCPNIELTKQLQNGLTEKPANADLVDIASRWFTKTPKKILKEIPISDDKGNLTKAKLSSITIQGAW
ncbi:MAG: DUF2026 domain-containing protein [Planctomycetes bacterium]|nr:DUF2026 domain-containing protein [Planctomycetota bacterium]